MYKFLFLLFSFLSYTPVSSANGVGTPLEKVLQGSFASFFHIKEQSRSTLSFGQQEIHYKTGGFKEFIDLTLIVDKEDLLLTAHLQVNYTFIKEQNRFAIDVIKSFIDDFCPKQDQAVCSTLADRLWNGEGTVAPELETVMNLFQGSKKWACSPLTACVLNTQAQEETLNFSYHFINWTTLAIPSPLFLSDKDLKKYPLQLTQEEATFKIWTPKGNTKKLPCTRLVDGRWLFETAEEAHNYYQAYQIQQSEGMAFMSDFEQKLGHVCAVYENSPTQIKMLARMGIGPEKEFYCFLIRKGKSIAKVFVVVSSDASIAVATKIAQKAVRKL
ncbi:MAG: hypothetical protein ACRBFS_08405 [Aureispira sp.]